MESARTMARIALAVLALATLSPSVTFANPQTAVAVSVAVVEDCNIKMAREMVFPNYLALSDPNPDQGEAILDVVCSTGRNPIVHLGSDVTIAQDHHYEMAGPNNNRLTYNLSLTYPGNSGVVNLNLPTSNGSVYPVPIYGYIAPGQNVAPGLYTDSVEVSVSL